MFSSLAFPMVPSCPIVFGTTVPPLWSRSIATSKQIAVQIKLFTGVCELSNEGSEGSPAAHLWCVAVTSWEVVIIHHVMGSGNHTSLALTYGNGRRSPLPSS